MTACQDSEGGFITYILTVVILIRNEVVCHSEHFKREC